MHNVVQAFLLKRPRPQLRLLITQFKLRFIVKKAFNSNICYEIYDFYQNSLQILSFITTWAT